MMEKMTGESLDLTQENINRLKELFPEVLTEKKIDFDKLRLILGDEVETSPERYEFRWNGKNEAIKLSQIPSMGTLRPDKESSKNWEETENLYIEGDNLEVLKLLQKSYFGKIKMIYIDPPYNTGKDFVYKDNFHDNIANYKEITNQSTKANPETNGRYHTDWINMMYPRLRLARNLLKEDGVLLISLDDNEIHNLRKICDEIYGESNFIINICHKARASVSNDKIISPSHNHILLYAKNINKVFENRKYIGLDPNLDGFSNPDGDSRGPYKLTPVDGPGGAKKGNPYYEFLGVTGYFRYSKETMQEKYKDNLIVKTANGLQQKYFLSSAIESRKTDVSWWEDAGLTSNATRNLIELMEGKTFDTPKPVSLIIRMLKLFCHFGKEDIILDFFSGSCTTAHAVLEMNSTDDGNRKFIMVQIPELIDEKSDAYQSGFRTICEIGKERIHRAGSKILKESNNTNLDIGFKVFKLDDSNIKTWDPNTKDLENTLFNSVQNLKEDRTQEDLLYELMLKMGIELTANIEELSVDGKIIYNIQSGGLVICLEDEITKEVIDYIPNLKSPFMDMKVVFKEYGFKSDADKLNAIQNLKQHGIKDVRSV